MESSPPPETGITLIVRTRSGTTAKLRNPFQPVCQMIRFELIRPPYSNQIKPKSSQSNHT
jgi:hypothetical protein